MRTLASAEHRRASVDRQAELAINRYANALDYSHRTTDPKRTQDKPPPALQHAHTREADVRSVIERRDAACELPIAAAKIPIDRTAHVAMSC